MVTELERPPTQQQRRRYVMQIGMALVVLLSGVLIGSAGTIVLLRRRLVRAQQMDRPAVFAATVAGRMQREYQLTKEQTESVERVLSERLREIEAARGESLERVGAARDAFLADMRTILPPETYTRMERRFRTRERRFRWLFGLSETSGDYLPDPESPGPGPR